MSLVAQEIPKVGLVMETVKVVRWLKSVGDTLTPGEPLVEVESEKSVVELEATVAGRLVEILVQVDEEASVGDRIAWVESASAQPASPTAPSNTPVAEVPVVAQPAAAPAPSAPGPAGTGDRVAISPVARKLAAENGIPLAELTGSGPRGRIELDDVKRAISTKSSNPPPSKDESGTLTPMRRAMARAMTLSNATVPQFPVARSVAWTELDKARKKFSATLPADAAKLSVNDFLLQAVAQTLLEFPALNATFTGSPDAPDARIVPVQGAHIGLVIAVDNGLLVPVFHDVEQSGLAELARRRVDCVERGRRGHLKRDETDGATFSISNLGSRGPDRFTAIINPPQSAILAVGRQRDCATVRDGQVVVRPMSELTLTVDHRVADGRLASDFLTRLIEKLEGQDWRLA